ncbi:MAG: endonuclease/exonuclease/phosphatase family protein [Microbacterium sp.]|uniref:endonuclease/exonuclease/phosphatase family protein n=1 Tax=Microbacterium sp. TaxID=51671 RepID=UPI0039E54A53
MWRGIGILTTVLFAIASAVITWPQFFRLERTFPIAQIVSLRGMVALGFGVLLLLALLLALGRPLRRFAASLAIIALVATVANVAIVATRGTGADDLPEPTAHSLRVMTWNTAGEATDPGEIAHTAVAMQADIVALPETTEENGEAVAVAMRELGHRMWVHNAYYPGWDARSTTLLISPTLGDYSVIQSSKDGSSNTSTVPSAVAMPVDGDGPIVVAVHAVAPRQTHMADWRDDLQWLADQCASNDVIMAGDFNATVDNMAGLGSEGGTLGRCTDVASATGNGSVGTWSTDLPALLGAPIDHVMVSKGWEPTGSVVIRSKDDSGSDHRPLVVQLEPVDDAG